VNLDNVSRDDWIVGGLALLLAIDLLFFPWFSVGGGSVGGVSVPSFDFSGTDDPDGWLGILAVLASLLVVVDLAIERLSPQTEIPAISGSRTMTRFVLAVAAAVFMALKFVFNIHFSDFGWGFYLGVILVAALVYYNVQARQAPGIAMAGGMAAPAAPAPQAPPAAPAPQAPPAAEPQTQPVADPQATRIGQTRPAADPQTQPVADPQATRIGQRPRPEGSPPGGSEPPGGSSPPPGV
jgi:hypothetical protein